MSNLSMVIITTPESCNKCIFSECGEYCKLLGGRVQEFKSGTKRNYDYSFNKINKKYRECPLIPINTA